MGLISGWRIPQRRMWREIKLAKVACSGSLTLHFVNRDCVIAEIIYSTAHARRGTCLVRAVLCASLCALHPRTQQRYCCVRALSVGLARRGEDIVWLLLGRLHQPGESRCVCSSFSSSSLLPVSQHMPRLPWIQRTV